MARLKITVSLGCSRTTWVNVDDAVLKDMSPDARDEYLSDVASEVMWAADLVNLHWQLEDSSAA